jgi:hypothetical protein
VRFTLSKLSSGLVLALVTALLFLAPSGKTQAQSASRSFQMALWGYPSSVVPGSADTDIATFTEGQDQPPVGPSILIYLNWESNSSLPAYDWSRIVAVEIDEPYMNALVRAFGGDQSLNPCFPATGERRAVVFSTNQILAARAAALKSIAPLTRFWVNFTDHEVDWMMDPICPEPLNQPYIDVVSVDKYYAPFASSVGTYYVWFVANRATPHQQLALIPGTFHRTGTDSPPNADSSAGYIPSYFAYANEANQSCNLPLGGRGVTGSYDGCPVWIVMGWLSGTAQQGNDLYMGEQDSSSGPIALTWRAELALPLRPDLAHQLTPGQIVQAILPLLLNN